MKQPAVIKNHIHHHLDAFVVTFGNKRAILLVGAIARVYAVVVGGVIAVIGATGHIVFEHGSEPHCRHAEVVEIVEVVLYTFEVATMASTVL